MPRDVDCNTTVILPVVTGPVTVGYAKVWMKRTATIEEWVDLVCWSDPLAPWDAHAEEAQ